MLLAVASKLYHGPLQSVIRGNAGDTLVVISLYFVVRAVSPRLNGVAVAAGVFALGAAVELGQAAGLLDGSLTPAANYWLGHRFDLFDLLAYGVGAAVSPIIDAAVTPRACEPPPGADEA